MSDTSQSLNSSSESLSNGPALNGKLESEVSSDRLFFTDLVIKGLIPLKQISYSVEINASGIHAETEAAIDGSHSNGYHKIEYNGHPSVNGAAANGWAANGHCSGHTSANGHSLAGVSSEATIVIFDDMVADSHTHVVLELRSGSDENRNAEFQRDVPDAINEELAPAGVCIPKHLHRLASARRAKGISCEDIARRLKISPDEVMACEHSESDLPVSLLKRWAEALGVPMSRLVIEPEANLMKTKLGRLQAARLMRIVHRLRAQSRKRTVERLAETFIEQLVEIAPSLEALARKVPPKRARKQNTEKLGLPTKLSEDVFTSPPEH